MIRIFIKSGLDQQIRSNQKLQRASKKFILNQERKFWGWFAGGAIVFGVFKIAEYSFRAIQNIDAVDDNTNVASGMDVNDQRSTSKKAHEGIVLGIDIGSAFSRISVKNYPVGISRIVENMEGHRATASAIFFSADKIIVGNLARSQRWNKLNETIFGIQLLIGAKKNNPLFTEITSTLPHSYSPHMKNDEVIFSLKSTSITPSDFISILSNELATVTFEKLDIINKNNNAQNIFTVLALPSYFNSVQNKMALDACNSSIGNATSGSSNNIITITAPDSVCALLGALSTDIIRIEDNKNILVVDIGARITQFSLLDCEHYHSRVSDDSTTTTAHSLLGGPPTVIWSEPYFNIGCDFLEDAVVQHIRDNFARASGLDLLTDPLAKQRLYDATDAAIIGLTHSYSSPIYLPFITADKYGPKHLDIKLSRAQFESIIEPVLALLKQRMSDTLKIHSSHPLSGSSSPTTTTTGGGGGHHSKDTYEEINLKCLLVGGGARIPSIKKAVEDTLGIEVITGQMPEELVSLGAAAAYSYNTTR